MGNEVGRALNSFGDMLRQSYNDRTRTAQLSAQVHRQLQDDAMALPGKKLAFQNDTAQLAADNRELTVGSIVGQGDENDVEFLFNTGKDGKEPAPVQEIATMLNAKVIEGRFIDKATGRVITHGSLKHNPGTAGIPHLLAARTGLGRTFRTQKERLNRGVASGEVTSEQYEGALAQIKEAESPENQIAMREGLIAKLESSPFSKLNTIQKSILRHRGRIADHRATIAKTTSTLTAHALAKDLAEFKEKIKPGDVRTTMEFYNKKWEHAETVARINAGAKGKMYVDVPGLGRYTLSQVKGEMSSIASALKKATGDDTFILNKVPDDLNDPGAQTHFERINDLAQNSPDEGVKSLAKLYIKYATARNWLPAKKVPVEGSFGHGNPGDVGFSDPLNLGPKPPGKGYTTYGVGQ